MWYYFQVMQLVVKEGALRAVHQAKVESSDTVNVEHLEKILAQLVSITLQVLLSFDASCSFTLNLFNLSCGQIHLKIYSFPYIWLNYAEKG